MHVKRKSSNAQVKKWGLFGPTSTFMVAREDKKWVLFGSTSITRLLPNWLFAPYFANASPQKLPAE